MKRGLPRFCLGSFFLFLIACESGGEKQNVFGLQSSPLVQQSKFKNPLQIGELVPDFVLQDEKGRSFQLSSFRGNYVFLNFWATWCPPCIEELPSMEALNFLWRTKNFSMLAVSVDDSWEIIFNFLRRLSREPSFLILHDPSKSVSTELYGTTKFPETFLIDPEGRLIRRFDGAKPWNSPAVLSELEAIMGWK